MTTSLTDRIIKKLPQLHGLYHRLLLVVAQSGGGKTAALLKIREQTEAPIINVGLELSRLLLSESVHQKSLNLTRMLNELVLARHTDTMLLDNTEILFDAELQQDPLRLLQNLSRNLTIVAAWSGSIVGNSLVYAKPGHPEYRSYSSHDLLIECPTRTQDRG